MKKEEPSINSVRGNPSSLEETPRFVVPTGTYRTGADREASLESPL